MRLDPTPLGGLFVVRPEPVEDERGFFARLYCHETFKAAGADFTPVQMSLSSSTARHTLRGLHWQDAPHGETKLVRATSGAIFDVAVDLREDSATYRQWFALELSAANRLALLIPPGFAHGLLTLAPNTEVLYAMDAPHVSAAGRGARFDDRTFAIDWPAMPKVIAPRDLAWPAWGRP